MTTTVKRPPATRGPATRRDDIQGMRGLAVLIVVLYHAELAGFAGGFVGVDVFFVLSGFVITRLIDRELFATGSIDFRRFYVRRVRRLLPASAVLLFGVAVMSAFLLSPFGPQQTTAGTGTAASLFSANGYLYVSPAGYFDAPALLNPLLHMWSLAVEEQFYVVFPLVLLFAWRAASRTGHDADNVRNRMAVVLTVIAIGSFVLSTLVSYADGPIFGVQAPGQLAFYASPLRAWEFIAGALLALAAARTERVPAGAERMLGLLGLAMVVVATALLDESVAWPGTAALLPVVGTVLMILGGTRGNGPMHSLLAAKPLVVLGDLSYSWYLWHWPAIVFARSVSPGNDAALLAAALLSLIPSVLSYRLIEEPVRHADRIVGWNAVRLAGVCITVPIVAFAGLRLGANQGWGSDNIAEVEAASALHLDQQNRCGTVSIADPGEDCRFAVNGAPVVSGERIVLLGDSSAGQFSEVVLAAATEVGRPLDIVTRHGCPVAPLSLPSDSACERFSADSVQQLLAEPPAVLILSNAIDGYLREDISWDLPGGTNLASASEAKGERWIAAWSPVLSELEARGTEVLVMATNLRFDDWFLAGCPTYKLAGDPASCGTSAPAEELLANRADADAVLSLTVDGTGARIVDLFEVLCPGETCVTNDGADFRYRDGVHLSIDGALSLTPTFVDELRTELER